VRSRFDAKEGAKWGEPIAVLPLTATPSRNVISSEPFAFSLASNLNLLRPMSLYMSFHLAIEYG